MDPPGAVNSNQQALKKRHKYRLGVNFEFELWQKQHSSPQTTIEIQLRYKHFKLTKFSNGSTMLRDITFSPWLPSHLIQVPDVHILALPKASAAFLSSKFSEVQGLFPIEQKAVAEGVAERVAELSVKCMAESRESGYTGVELVLEIEVMDASIEHDCEEIREMMSRESEVILGEGDGDLGTCGVCLEDMEVRGSPLGKVLPCRRFFHHSCIVDWFSVHSYCPLCHSDILVLCSISREGFEGNGDIVDDVFHSFDSMSLSN